MHTDDDGIDDELGQVVMGQARQFGAAGMVDRSSHPVRSPTRTPQRGERQDIELRVLRRWGLARIGWRLGINPSTVHRVLTRWGWRGCGGWSA